MKMALLTKFSGHFFIAVAPNVRTPSEFEPFKPSERTAFSMRENGLNLGFERLKLWAPFAILFHNALIFPKLLCQLHFFLYLCTLNT